MPKRVAVIEGEDASPEAVRPTVELVDRLETDIEWVRPLVGGAAMDQGLPAFPDDARALIDSSDATLFGAASGKSIPALVYLRWGRDTFANVRPCRYIAGCQSPLKEPGKVDLVIVRENTEDLYVGAEGDLALLEPLGLTSSLTQKPVRAEPLSKFALKVISAAASERVARHAFELARRRRSTGHPGKLTCATKHNVLRQTDGLFRDSVEKVSEEFPEIELETLVVDDFAHKLVKSPDAFDVVVTPNLYGDVLSDAAAGLVGGLGVAPSGCYGQDYAYFESVHGTAPDIAGQNIINPTATILSAVMLLDYLGFEQSARQLEGAVVGVYADGRCLTPDQGGKATTTEFCAAVAARL